MSRFFLLPAFIFLAIASQAQNTKVEYLDENKDIIYDLAMADSTKLIALAPGYIATWDLNTKTITHRHTTPEANLTCLDVSANGEWTVFGNKSGEVTVLRTGTSEIIFSKDFPTAGVVTDMKFGASDSLIAVTFYSGFFAVISLDSRSSWEYNIPSGRAHACGFSESGQYIAIGDDKGMVRIYDLNSRTRISEYAAGASLITEINWTAQDTKIITASNDGKINICNNVLDQQRQYLTKRTSQQGTISGAGHNANANSTYFCTLQGLVKIIFDMSASKFKTNVALHAITVIPTRDIYTTMAVGTNGKGILLVNSKNMKSN